MNKPTVKVGIVAVSRDCFPESLSVTRRQNLVNAYKAKYNADEIYECPVCIVESEIHMMQALEDIKKQDAMHFVYILETLVLRFQRLCLHSILTVLRCLLRQQKRHLRMATCTGQRRCILWYVKCKL